MYKDVPLTIALFIPLVFLPIIKENFQAFVKEINNKALAPFKAIIVTLILCYFSLTSLKDNSWFVLSISQILN